jgi:type I restriction enzyme S subunit
MGRNDFTHEGCPVLTIGCLTDSGIRIDRAAYVRPDKANDLDRYRLRAGDLLFSRMASVGRAGMVTAALNGALFNYHIMRLRLSEQLMLPELFLAYVRGAPAVSKYLEDVNHGATRDGINTAQLVDMPVLLPPLAEQRRIVAKLEALQTRSRRAREALDAVPPLLEKLRQSILAAAFRGDLTKDWRAKQKDLEPATELLKRIRTARRQKWESTELAKLKSKGKPPIDDKWRAKYPEPDRVDGTSLPALPDGWCWASADEILLSLRNGISTKPDRAEGLRILRISAVRPQRVDVDDVRFLPPDDKYDDYRLADGDLLLTRYNGNAELVGVAAVVRGLRSTTVYPDKLIRATVVQASILPEFLELALNTGRTRVHIADRGKSAAGQIGISGNDIRTAPVPVPPLAEQRAIVACVATLTARIAPTLGSVQDVRAMLKELDTAVLAKAFRGELVPQDPNDEPAEAMLARARATTDAALASVTPQKRGRPRSSQRADQPND